MKILDLLDFDEGRVVSFELSKEKDSIVVVECCDFYFNETLNKEQFGQLISELQELHDQMIDVPTVTEG